MRGRFAARSLIGSLLVGSLAFGADLRMSIEPVFDGFAPTMSPAPITVILENVGADAEGYLHLSSDGFEMDYPVSLPRGSVKRVITYPTIGYSGINFSLRTNKGFVSNRFQPESYAAWEQRAVVMITDNFGDLAFLKSGNTGNQNTLTLTDTYCRPGRAPDRAAGYRGIAAVVMGPGTERLTDAEVDALKMWTISGGTLIFTGGASAPVLADPRWMQALPASKFRPETLQSSKKLAALGGGIEVPRFTLLDADPTAGARTSIENGKLLTAERGYGLGRVIYLAFDPFDQPLDQWPGRRTAFNRLVPAYELGVADRFVGAFARDERTMDPYATATTTVAVPGGPPPVATAPTAPVPYSGPEEMDPFSAELPPTGKVFTILSAYFVVVVPLNFLILRKLKRGELAWLTAPLISLAFAGVLFTSAQSLYSAKMSTATQGILICQEGLPQGLFVGTTQMFMPRGGRYDLKLTKVDSLGIATNPHYYYDYRQTQSMADLDAEDVGEIIVRRMPANNLAFKEISYRQQHDVDGWFEIEVLERTSRSTKVAVTNKSPYEMSEPVVYGGKTLAHETGRKIAPGQRATFEIDAATSGENDRLGDNDPRHFLRRTGGIAVQAFLSDFRPGPQIGEEVPSRRKVQLIAFAEETVR